MQVFFFIFHPLRNLPEFSNGEKLDALAYLSFSSSSLIFLCQYKKRFGAGLSVILLDERAEKRECLEANANKGVLQQHVSYKRDKNLGNFLVRSSLKTDEQPGSKCSRTRCNTCPFIQNTITFHGSKTLNQGHRSIWLLFYQWNLLHHL